jgi:hypothetical protein
MLAELCFERVWLMAGLETLAVRGLEELFSSCAVVSVFGSGGK